MNESEIRDILKEALDMFSRGFNCTQSVFIPCALRFGLDEEIALRLSCCFGGGLSHSDSLCGVVAGSLMVIGLERGMGRDMNKEQKHIAYRTAREFVKKFADKNGSINCTSLLGLNLSNESELEQARSRDLFHLVCPKYIESALNILKELKVLDRDV